ncbi:hypothetical protein I316_07522 [Kwoniella heveanensis BCC8398]|uniref:Uncharacterized protein n=1 Tax=Kwoniella heveanensis BCC8398 TaxID=1296120 RepID=A0A1B9GIG0_9TREE|nr:hypothetical protein I316_07522 [Kwoniella heveanensis BCC8398]
MTTSTRSHIEAALEAAEASGDFTTADLLCRALREVAKGDQSRVSNERTSAAFTDTAPRAGAGTNTSSGSGWDPGPVSTEANEACYDTYENKDADADADDDDDESPDSQTNYHPSRSSRTHFRRGRRPRSRSRSPPRTDYSSTPRSHSSGSGSGNGDDVLGAFTGGLLGSIAGSVLGSAFTSTRVPQTSTIISAPAPAYYSNDYEPVVVGTRYTYWPGFAIF